MSQSRQPTMNPLFNKLIDKAIYRCSHGDGEMDDLDELALSIKMYFRIESAGPNYKQLLALPFSTPTTSENQQQLLDLQHKILHEARLYYRSMKQLFLFRAALVFAFAAKWFPVYVQPLDNSKLEEVMAIINKEDHPVFETFILNFCNKSETFTNLLNMLWFEIEKPNAKREECIKFMLEEIIDDSSLVLKTDFFTTENLTKLKTLLSIDEIEQTVIPLLVARQATQFMTQHRKLYELENAAYGWIFDFVSGKDPVKKPEIAEEKPKVVKISPKPAKYKDPVIPMTNHAYNPVQVSSNIHHLVMNRTGLFKPQRPAATQSEFKVHSL